jgi:hypothetical protein
MFSAVPEQLDTSQSMKKDLSIRFCVYFYDLLSGSDEANISNAPLFYM